MKRYFVAAAVAVGAILGTTPLSAAGIFDSFRLDFSDSTIGSRFAEDPHGHHTDFRHYGDYYIYPGYGDPQRNTSCHETSVQGEDGRIIQRITCYGRQGATAVPLR